jgi:hypothetical protein
LAGRRRVIGLERERFADDDRSQCGGISGRLTIGLEDANRILDRRGILRWIGLRVSGCLDRCRQERDLARLDWKIVFGPLRVAIGEADPDPNGSGRKRARDKIACCPLIIGGAGVPADRIVGSGMACGRRNLTAYITCGRRLKD